MKTAAALLAAMALVAGCGGSGIEMVVVDEAENVQSETEPHVGITTPEALASATPPLLPTPVAWSPPDLPADFEGLEDCADVPRLGSRFEGTLGARQNPDPIVTGVLHTYGREHPETYGGQWIDRENGGALVIGFTDDPEPHRQAILARAPSPEDQVGVRPRPPIDDSRPLGERDDVVIDVVQVRFNNEEMLDMADQVSDAMKGWTFGLSGMGIYRDRQRVNLLLVNPREGVLEVIAELVPDPSAVCVEITRTTPPPEGPLDVLPDLDEEDPLVSCYGTPAVRYSQMINPPSIDEIDHPAIDVLRAELAFTESEPLPRGPWVVINIDDDSATFAVLSENSVALAGVERRGERWVYAGEAYGPLCEPRVPLPPGLGRVEVHLDGNSMPGPLDTSINVLVTEQGCASGRDMGEALRGPQVIETENAVLLAFAVVPVSGGAECPDNPATATTVELSEPLGDRWIYDGLHIPPKPLTAPSDPWMYRDRYSCVPGSYFAESDRLNAGASTAESPDGFESANEALLAHLGDLSEPLYDIWVAERGFGYEKWRIAVEDSEGAIHLGNVQANRTAAGGWQIAEFRWCLTNTSNRHDVKNVLERNRQGHQPPANFSECPMMSEGHFDYFDPNYEGPPTPGAVLRENLSVLPTASYTIRVAEATDQQVRWEITLPSAPWGLTYGNYVAIEDNGWRMHTSEWCHMEPDRLDGG